MAPSLGSPDSLLELLDNKKQTPITLEGGKLMVNGRPFLSEVPPCIALTPYSSLHTEKALDRSGCFIGFDSDTPKSRHVVSLGKLRGIRFMSLFRFKVWWTTHWVGDKGSDLEYETQIVILDKSDSGRPYVLLLPLIEQAFRSSLQPGEDDNVDICVESGSTLVMGSTFRSSLYVHTGDNPYDLVKDAIKAVRAHLGTFKLLEEKTPPGIVDKFGWCTWDAFYLAVHPEGVWEGVKVLVEGGCPPGLVLIDDGWQSICHDDDPITDQEGMNRTAAGEQMPCRLIKVQENYKFRDYKSKLASTMASPNENHVDENGGGHKSHVDKGLGAFVRDLKSSFKTVEHVYVWHALCGYWGGIRPQVPGMPNASLVTPKLSPGLQMTMEDLAVDKIVNNGIGLVPPEQAYDLYDGLHAHLASNGIDGVKVDVIHVLEMLSEDYGGRVNLAKAYYKAISASVKEHFKGNGVIASMEHCNDFMFLGTEAISLGRVGDDFWCADESGDRGNPSDAFWLQGCHMVHCSYNSLWMGNFIHPDWDMFQSVHPCAAFHAASRVISGGPIYISDAIGKHDFQLLKSLVLPDGSILRCEFYALPTRDCLFESPLLDGKTMLKIWNLNKVTGVVGAFNCQGGGWCRKERKNRDFSEFSRPVKSTVNPNSIEWKNGKLSNWSIEGIELFAVYLFKAKQLVLLRQEESVEISLEPFDFELFTVSPVKIVSEKRVEFAPIGLVNMLNSGGAIQSANYGESSVEIEVKGAGELRVFSSEKPETCQINGKEVGFVYDVDRMVVIEVTWPDPLGVSLIEYLF